MRNESANKGLETKGNEGDTMENEGQMKGNDVCMKGT